MCEKYLQAEPPKIWLYLFLSLMFACCALSGCTGGPCTNKTEAGVTTYDRCLAKHESVTNVTEFGRFTAISISYDEPYGYWGGHLTYQRILHSGRVVVNKAHDVKPWTSLSNTVLFTDFIDEDRSASSLHLIYEQAERTVVERIDSGDAGWVADHEFPYGYPLHKDVRYFPRYAGANDAGFLLRIFPTRVTKLPHGPEGARAPWIQSLVGISPDGKAYAYADSIVTPSAVVVVDADGSVHDPIPIPVTSLTPSTRVGSNPYELIWRWFPDSFTWRKDERNRWGIVPAWAGTASPSANPVEELFIDASSGYLICFDSANPLCEQGWRSAEGIAEQFGFCCISPPTLNASAFDADVAALIYAKSATSGSGYQLLLKASPDHVVAALNKRLKSRKMPFEHPERCPVITQAEAASLVRLKQDTHWKTPEGQEALRIILNACQYGDVFITPTVALAVYRATNGWTFVDTLARYELTTP